MWLVGWEFGYYFQTREKHTRRSLNYSACYVDIEGKIHQSVFCTMRLCLWILTIHHQGIQGSVNVYGLSFYLNNPFWTPCHVQLRSQGNRSVQFSFSFNIYRNHLCMKLFVFMHELRVKCLSRFAFCFLFAQLQYCTVSLRMYHQVSMAPNWWIHVKPQR